MSLGTQRLFDLGKAPAGLLGEGGKSGLDGVLQTELVVIDADSKVRKGFRDRLGLLALECVRFRDAFFCEAPVLCQVRGYLFSQARRRVTDRVG